MFRCPNCGQAERINFNGMVITQNEEMTKVYVDGEERKGIKLAPGFEIECHKCPEGNPSEKWMEAFEEPLMYFEMEHDQLCHCGGELYMDVIPGTRKYGFVCEKCEWVKPKKEVSGA